MECAPAGFCKIPAGFHIGARNFKVLYTKLPATLICQFSSSVFTLLDQGSKSKLGQNLLHDNNRERDFMTSILSRPMRGGLPKRIPKNLLAASLGGGASPPKPPTPGRLLPQPPVFRGYNKDPSIYY